MSAPEIDNLKSKIPTVVHRNENSMEVSNASFSPSKVKISKDSDIEEDSKLEINDKTPDETSNLNLIQRPRTLEAFKEQESLTEISNLESTLNLSELDEDDEFWIIEVPITVDPMQLKNQVLKLGDKSKFKFGNDRYCAVPRDCKPELTCVFPADDNSPTYKAVNIKSAGAMNVRRKLSGTSKNTLHFEKFIGVPTAQNIKIRHPFFGAQNNQ